MNSKKGMMFILLTAVISGFSIFVNKFSITQINPYIFTFSKNLAVLLFTIGSILLFKEFNILIKLKKSQWFKLTLIGLFGGSIPFLLFFKGLSMTSAVNAALIHKTMFIFIAILAIFFLKEKLSKGWLIGAILLLTGNFLLLKITNLTFNTGDFLILTAVLFWSIENIISKHVLKELTTRTVIFGRFFFGSLFMLIYFALSGNLTQFASLNTPSFLWIALTATFLLLYNLTWYSGLRYLNVSKAACILLLGAPITTLLNFIYFGTMITLSQSIGILFILTGIIFAIGISQFNFTINKSYY